MGGLAFHQVMSPNALLLAHLLCPPAEVTYTGLPGIERIKIAVDENNVGVRNCRTAAAAYRREQAQDRLELIDIH